MYMFIFVYLAVSALPRKCSSFRVEFVAAHT